jgi:hopanoid biosynthesis associated radical SAM protein HpnH
MRFPLHITTDMMRWQLKNRLKGNKRFPVVLMLEPLYTCNLACLGCTPERHTGDIRNRLSLDQCVQALDESGAPVLSICGGEPTIYPELVPLVEAAIARKRHIYLCTNGILLDRFFEKAKPHPRLSINVHLDGMRDTHDFVCDRDGVFDKAIAMIQKGLSLGYHVCTNTTVFKETSVEEIEEMMRLLTSLGVKGMLISPGYHYEKLSTDHFMFRKEIHEKFTKILALSAKYPVYNTPLFLEFAAGRREYPCTPWGNVTRTPMGWKGPCYLIGEKYFPTWEEFWTKVDWDYWERREDERCQNCFMHSGFEPSVVRKLGESWSDMWTMARWQFLS